MCFRKCSEVLTSEGKRATTDLQKIHPHYYEVGHLCTSLYHEDAGDLAEMLPEVITAFELVIRI